MIGSAFCPANIIIGWLVYVCVVMFWVSVVHTLIKSALGWTAKSFLPFRTFMSLDLAEVMGERCDIS